jgi:hypothetical protein
MLPFLKLQYHLAYSLCNNVLPAATLYCISGIYDKLDVVLYIYIYIYIYMSSLNIYQAYIVIRGVEEKNIFLVLTFYYRLTDLPVVL